jgi:hypothetical protein
MPWRMERDGASLRIWVACPMNDWDLLFDEAVRQVEHENDLGYIEMPRRIPGATPIDAEALELMRTVLAHVSGLEVRAI